MSPLLKFFWRGLYWTLSLLLAITLTPLAVLVPYAAVIFFRGNLEEVKGWLVHLQIEGQPLKYSQGQMTWFDALRPWLIASTTSLAFWAVRRVLRPKFQVAGIYKP